MLKELLQGSPGFAAGLGLQADELERVRDIIERQWLKRIEQVAPEQTQAFAARGIARYHELSHLVDHTSIWPRDSRLLSAAEVAEIRQMSIFKQLEAEFGELAISDEEKPGKEVVNWRLVRPNKADVGPIHADKWFWDLNRWPMPPEVQRLKVWLAIYCEPGLSGLRLIPDSHFQDWPYCEDRRHGILKPKIQVSETELSPQLFPSQPGDALIFHDKLLHGGAISRGNLTRVSLEFTLLVPNRVYDGKPIGINRIQGLAGLTAS